MSTPFSVALPTQLQRRGEIVGIICGALCFPFAFFGGSLGSLLPAGPAGVILPIVLNSAVAGIIACLLGSIQEAEEMASFAPRVGVRAGLVATLTGGALTVLAATIHAFGIGQPNPNSIGFNLFSLVLPTSRPRQILVIALLGIPPSVFFGMAGALITAMFRTQPLPMSDGRTGKRSAAIKRSTLFTVVLLLSAIGYLSPFLLFLKPKPKPLPPPVIVAPPPPPPKWHYQRAADFDTADASRIVVTNQKTIDDIESTLPVAISPDGLRFAYCERGNGTELLVRDLESFDIVARVSIVPNTLAWSPDSKRLIAIGKNERNVHVLDIASSRLMTLPQPADERVPNGEASWWDAEEVFFMEKNGSTKLLNLDILRVRPGDESAKLKLLTKDDLEAIRQASPRYLPGNSRWQMKLRGVTRSYEVPLRTSDNWTTSESLCLFFEQPDKAVRFLQPTIDVNIGDQLAASSDGTKLVRIRDRRAEVYYFGTRTAPATTFKVSMSAAPEASLSDAMAKKSVCAFVCPPLINPLNGKTVGPDRQRVKAIVRIASWNDKEAEFWTDESYFPIQTGDVVADLHTWSERIPQAAGELGRNEWFAVIEKLDATAAIPSRADAPPLDKMLTAIFNSRDGADLVQRLETNTSRKPAAPTPTPAPTVAPTVNNPPQAMSPNTDEEKNLSAFIASYHANASRGNVAGMVAAYADRVEYMSHGVVSRDFIAKDIADYQGPGVRVTNNILTRPTFSQEADGETLATYDVAFSRQTPDGKWTRGTATFELSLRLSPAGPRITEVHIKIRNSQQGP